MLSFKIQIEYTTGDSYSSEDRKFDLELTWTKIHVAKENLQRIKEHYEYYKFLDRGFYLKEVPKKPDYFDDKNKNIIQLLTDDGDIWQINAFWCGYFEFLKACEIVLDNGDWRIEF